MYTSLCAILVGTTTFTNAFAFTFSPATKLDKFHIPFEKSKHVTSRSRFKRSLCSTSSEESNAEWTPLIEEPNNPHPPVKKKIISAGASEKDLPPPQSKVTISYVTTLASPDDINWNEHDVVNCFLVEQQGLHEMLSTAFIDKKITLEKMLDMENFFTDDFIKDDLGIENKIQAKKLAMAVRRLKNTREEYLDANTSDNPLILDSNTEFTFSLGAGKVIQAMEALVGSMSKGEKAKMVCRADYGYGKEGLRKRNGDVIVPSFADLCFEIELLDFV